MVFTYFPAGPLGLNGGRGGGGDVSVLSYLSFSPSTSSALYVCVCGLIILARPDQVQGHSKQPPPLRSPGPARLAVYTGFGDLRGGSLSVSSRSLYGAVGVRWVVVVVCV